MGDKGLRVPREANARCGRTHAVGEVGEFFRFSRNPYVEDGGMRLRSKGTERSEGEAEGREGTYGLAEFRSEFGKFPGRDVPQEEERNVVILRMNGRLEGEGSEEVVRSGGKVQAHGRRDGYGDEHALACGL